MTIQNSVAIQAELASRSYVTVSPDAVLSCAERAEIGRQVFALGQLERDQAHVHPLRDRVYDSVRFLRSGERLDLSEAPGNHPDPTRLSLQLKANYSQPRHYKRFLALDIEPVRKLIDAVIGFVPVADRRMEGQCDIHAITTRGIVVPAWHRDGSDDSPVDWVVAYVVSKAGAGACTSIASDRGGREIIAKIELQPGQMVMHRDDCFYHYVSPLEATETAPDIHRSALILMLRPVLTN